MWFLAIGWRYIYTNLLSNSFFKEKFSLSAHLQVLYLIATKMEYVILEISNSLIVKNVHSWRVYKLQMLEVKYMLKIIFHSVFEKNHFTTCITETVDVFISLPVLAVLQSQIDPLSPVMENIITQIGIKMTMEEACVLHLPFL